MIYNKKGEIFVHRLINVCIGDYVLANEKSDYSGLVGVVREIRTDEDKEAENESADIYVDFLKPKNPEVLFEIEERFNDLSGEEKEFEEMAFDQVIMAPEMLISMSDVRKKISTDKVFVVYERWEIDGEDDFEITLFSEEKVAKDFMLFQIYKRNKKFDIDEENANFLFEKKRSLSSYWISERAKYYEIYVISYSKTFHGGGSDE